LCFGDIALQKSELDQRDSTPQSKEIAAKPIIPQVRSDELQHSIPMQALSLNSQAAQRFW
jgi:hypothetical protein